MTDIAINPNTGEAVKWDRQTGSWIPASQAELEVAESGLKGQALSAFEGATGIVSMVNPERGAALRTVNPTAATAGLVGSLGAGAAGFIRGGAGKLARREARETMAERVAGGSRFRTESGLIRRPADIAPGPLQGSARAFEAGFEAYPGLRLMGDAIKLQRQNKALSAANQALGMQGSTRLTRSQLDQALTPVDNAYDAARDAISANVKQSDLNKVLEMKPVQKAMTDAEITQLKSGADDMGETLLDLRSELRAAQRGEAKRRKRKELGEAIQAIQDIIRDAVPTGVKAELDEADRIYKVWKTLDGAAISPEGYINPAALRRSIRKNYGARATTGGRGIGDERVEALFRVADEMGQLGNPLPSSGTAERTIAGSIVAGGIGGAVGSSLLD